MPIREICPAEQCTGCLACYNKCPAGAIKITSSDEGFLFPVIDDSVCADCGICINTCPTLVSPGSHRSSPSTYAAWSKNKDLLLSSSSGGIFSEIAIWIIEHGGAVYGASFTDKWDIKHIRVKDVDSLQRLRGSKYVQSYIGHCYIDIKKDLLNGILVLFSGTPCQVAGLYEFMKGTRYDKSKLITVDLVCHGVPSPRFFKDYINFLGERQNSTITEYSFRDKKWSWVRYNTRAKFSNGKIYCGTWEGDPFMRGFLRDYCLRKSCYSCQFAVKERLGDFTLCDYWGYRKRDGECDNKDYGVSLVLVHNDKSKRIFDEIKPQLFCYSRGFEEAIESNPAFHHPFPQPILRPKFWEDYDRIGFAGIVEKYCYPDSISPLNARKYKYGRRVDMFIRLMGSVKRGIRGLFSQG